MDLNQSIDPVSAFRKFYEKKQRFICEHGGEYPTRVVLDWRVYEELTEQYRIHMVRCEPPEDGKTRYEGMEVIRTHYSPGLIEFLP